jgi:hypothetical protein
MKIRAGALICVLISIAGLVMYTTLPVISVYEREKGEDMVGTYNFATFIRCFFFGNGKFGVRGELYGTDITSVTDIDVEDWSEDFPTIVPILTLVGLGLAVLGSILLVIRSKAAKIVGALLGIAGGALAITGQMLFLDWGNWFITTAGGGLEWTFYTWGFFAACIAGGLIALLSLIFLLIPDRGKASAY